MPYERQEPLNATASEPPRSTFSAPCHDGTDGSSLHSGLVATVSSHHDAVLSPNNSLPTQSRPAPAALPECPQTNHDHTPLDKPKRPRGRPRTKPVVLGPKRPVGRPKKKADDNDAPKPKRRPGRPPKKSLPVGSVVINFLEGPIRVPGNQRREDAADGDQSARATHPFFQRPADVDPSVPLSRSDENVTEPAATNLDTLVDRIEDDDDIDADKTHDGGRDEMEMNEDREEVIDEPERDESDIDEADGVGIGEGDEGDVDDEADDDDDDNHFADNDDDPIPGLEDNSTAGPQGSAKPKEKRIRRPLPEWLMQRFRSRLAEFEQRDENGLPALYAKDKTFWFPAQSTYFTLSDGSLSPSSLYEVRFFGWDPKALIPDLPCPNCRYKLNRHSAIPRPRRVVNLDSTFYLIGFRYKCTHCVNPKTLKRTVTFRSWDRRILAILPPALAAEFPAHLTHRSAISHRLRTWMRSCFAAGMEAKRFADALRTQHLLRYDELQLKYLNYILSRPMDRFLLHKKYTMFLPFEDTSSEGFHGYVPSFTYLRDIYVDYMHEPEHMQVIVKMRVFIPLYIISVDHSFKIPKHILKYLGESVFPALFAVAAGSMARCLDLASSKSHAQMRISLEGIEESNRIYGLPGPQLAYTDNIADRYLLESVFPSLREGVIPTEKHGDLPPYTLPRGIEVIPIRDEKQMNTMLSAILNDVPVDASSPSLVVGFDCEWNFAKTDFGHTDRGDVAVIQIAYKNRVLVLQVAPFIAQRRLPTRLVSFLSNPRILKAGRMVSSDLKQLEKLVRPLSRFVGELELGDYAKARRAIGTGNCSLADLCASVLKLCLHKNASGVQTCMDWEHEILSDAQLSYAACDAYVGLELYERLSTYIVPQKINKKTPISSPVLVYHNDGTSIIAYGILKDRKEAKTIHNLKLLPSQVAVEVTKVLVPGAIVASRPKKVALRDLGQPPFHIAVLRRHVFSVDSRTITDSDEAPMGMHDGAASGHTTSVPPEEDPLVAAVAEAGSSMDGTSVGELLEASDDTSELESEEEDDVPMCSVSNASAEQGLKELASIKAPDPRYDHVLRTRVLKDIFHVFNMIKLSPKHGLSKDFARRLRDILLVPDIEDRARISAWAASQLDPPLTFQQLQATKPKWLWKHCRRVIRPPSVIFPLVKQLFLTYGPLEDALTGRPLFAAHNWKIARSILELIKNGYLSDPPGIPLYTLVRLDRNAGYLPIYRCARGTNFTEGGIHTHLRSHLPTSGASLKHYNAALYDFTYHHNAQAYSVYTTGKPFRGHNEPWLTNHIQERLLLLQSHDMVDNPVRIKSWLNTDFYVPTNERIGIQRIAEEVRRTCGMMAYNPMLVSKKKRQRLGYLAEMQETRKAVMPVHTAAEISLFQKLLEEDQTFRSLPRGSSWTLAAQVWNHLADEMDGVFYKTQEFLKSYYTKYQHRIDVRQTLAITLDARRPLIKRSLDAANVASAPPALSLPTDPCPHATSGILQPPRVTYSDGPAEGAARPAPLPSPTWNTLSGTCNADLESDTHGRSPATNSNSTGGNTESLSNEVPALIPSSSSPPPEPLLGLPSSSVFAALAEQRVAADFAGTVAIPGPQNRTSLSRKRRRAPDSDSGPVAKAPRSPRHCMKCGREVTLCGGAQNNKSCPNPCQDCGKTTCRGRNSKRPTRPCWEAWEPTKRKKRTVNIISSVGQS